MEDVGIGQTLTLQNRSSIGSSLNASAVGFTSDSPYVVDHTLYDDNNLSIIRNDNSLSIPTGNYKSILWNTGENNENINVTEPGLYSVTVETELCKFFQDSIIIENLSASIEDCVGADTICTASILMSNPQGLGIDDFENPNNDPGCNNLAERTSEWYYFEIAPNAPAGIPLGFTITPVGGQGEDYDFAIYGANPSCDSLGFPIRCSFASGYCDFCPQTGLGMGAVDLTEDAGGDGFVQELFVNSGDRFYLFVNNFNNSTIGFDLEWTGEGAQYLNCNPAFECTLEVDAGDDFEICMGDDGPSLNGSFTGQQLDNSVEWTLINSVETYLSDPNSLTPTVNLPSDASGIYDYILTVQDTSMNSGCFRSDTIRITLEDCFECMLQVDAGSDQTTCLDEEFNLNGGFVGDQLETTFWWELLDSTNTHLSDVNSLNPMVLLSNVGSFTYVLHVQDMMRNTGCTVSDTIQLTIEDCFECMLQVDAGPDESICSAQGYSLNGGYTGDQLETTVWWELLDSTNTYLSDVNSLNPMVLLSSVGTFTYVLHVQDMMGSSGCTVTDTVALEITGRSSDVLDISIVAPRLRPCSSRRMFVKYGNYTGEDAYSVDIDFTYDANEFTITSDVIPDSSNVGSMHWDIDTLHPGDRGVYILTIQTSCNTPVGDTYCFEARIDGEDPCGQQLKSADADLSLWDGVTLDLSSSCDEESVTFKIENIGEADMSQEYIFQVYSDDHVTDIVHSQLDVGQSENVVLPANGSTHRLEAPHLVNHPTYSEYVEVIEGCAPHGQSYSQGFVNQYPQDELEAQVDIACVTITNSFDPNEKSVYPIGTTARGFIEKDQWLEYRIDFQNIGTDVAYDVWIEDPLSYYLDESTLEFLHISPSINMPNRELAWNNLQVENKIVIKLKNINLPSMHTDEEGSKGFIIYRIKPIADINPGRVINNYADIYFDNNDPIRTNTTVNTINYQGHQNYVKTSTSLEAKKQEVLAVFISPNPGRDLVKIQGIDHANLINVSIYSIHGQQVFNAGLESSEYIDIQNLASGIYFIEIKTDTGRYTQKFEKL